MRTAHLPFDLPDLIGYGPRVFAHWFPAQPIAIQNVRPDWWKNHYLNPLGENGAFAYCGGYARDMPIQPPVSPAGVDWQLEQMKLDIRNAIRGGVDGFWVNLMVMEPQQVGGPQLWANRKIFEAAPLVHPKFKVGIMLDMTSGWLNALTITQVAAYISSLAQYPACFRIGRKVVISTFGADAVDAGYFRQLFDTLRVNHGIEVRFYPTFLNVEANMPRFKALPEVDVVGDWGDANPNWNDPAPGGNRRRRILLAQEEGWDFMMPIAIQDQRPREGIYDESRGFENLRRTWQIAREGGCRIVQLRTWNDYAEGAQFAPSMAHGNAILHLNAYYVYQLKTGFQPWIHRDGIYLAHRPHPHAAKPTWRPDLYTKKMSLRANSTPPVDMVEAFVLLKQDGIVRVSSGSNVNELAVKARVPTSVTVPLAPGEVSAEILRGGVQRLRLVAPLRVVSEPSVQDMGYWTAEAVSA